VLGDFILFYLSIIVYDNISFGVILYKFREIKYVANFMRVIQSINNKSTHETVPAVADILKVSLLLLWFLQGHLFPTV
jgi:hypothetical protein